MHPIRDAFAVIKPHGRAFLVLNVTFYGVFVAAMVFAALFPEYQESAIEGVNRELSQPGLGTAVSAGYDSGNVLWAAGITILVNLFVGALLTTTVPSFIIPFFGLAFTVYRAVQWGILFSPIGPQAGAFIPHVVTLIIEGQAFVIAALGVWVHGRMFLWPGHFGLPSRWAGYKAGLKATARLYPLILLILVVAAIYEAIEIIYLVPHFL